VRQYHQIAATPHSLKAIEDEVEIILKNFDAGLVDLYCKSAPKWAPSKPQPNSLILIDESMFVTDVSHPPRGAV
jgi:hypothetical protein